MAPQSSRKDSGKRKAPPPSTPSQTHRQQSIAHHFSSGQKSPDERSDSRKRRKPNISGTLCQPPIPIPVVAETMYNFQSGPTGSAQSPIDLTNGHLTSPRARRISSANRSAQSNSPYVGAKKLTVKNIRPKSSTATDHTQYLSTTSAQLDAALSSIFSNARPSLSNEELYRGVENICKLGQAADLAEKLLKRCDEHVMTTLKEPVLEKAGEGKEAVLNAVIEAWTAWTKQLSTIRSIFFFLDRSYLLQAQHPSLYDSSVAQFRSHIFADCALQPKVVNGACDLLLTERNGQAAPSGLFSSAVKMFHELGVYTSAFEPALLASSQRHISEWSDRACVEKELPEFVTNAVSLIADEMARCQQYELDPTTKRDLLDLLEHHLIDRRQEYLVDRDAIADLLDTDNEARLEQLYSLLQRRRMGAKLKVAFEQWIDDAGSDIIFDENGQDQMVGKLLALKRKLDHLWRFAFQKDETLGHSLREAFEIFINKSKKTSATWGTDNSKPGEMIAKYLDQLLRSGAKAIPLGLMAGAKKGYNQDEEDEEYQGINEDAEVNNQLDQVLDLFRFVHGKAVFEAFYKKDLARRLLMDRSASKDAEIAMLERLKSECGASFTQNLEQMFKDIELAKEEMSAYKSRLDAMERRPDVDLNVNILSASAWPSYPDATVIIPPEVQKAIESFEGVYHVKHTGRKLQWKHSLAHCQLRARFPKGNKELVVSSFQAIVLLLFNLATDGEHLSYERIKAESGLTDVECKRTLQSLACAKLRPLTKHPKGRDVNDDDTFTVNSNFSHDRSRIKINAIQLKETKEENKETHERVAEDRALETQAAIVRIMKSEKNIAHQQLLVETINATKKRGTLQPTDIKKQIDKLIEKEYMEREEDGTYTYLA